jgi:hypothetical protein
MKVIASMGVASLVLVVGMLGAPAGCGSTSAGGGGHDGGAGSAADTGGSSGSGSSGGSSGSSGSGGSSGSDGGSGSGSDGGSGSDSGSSSESGSGGNSATGTVGGVALAPQDAFFNSDKQGPSGTGQPNTILGITSFGGACTELYTDDHVPRSSADITMYLVSSGGPVTAPGTFTFASGTPSTGNVFSGATFGATDGACGETSVAATAGTVTVTSVSSTQLVGTFDLTFGAGHVTGTFSAARCVIPGSFVPGSITCQ